MRGIKIAIIVFAIGVFGAFMGSIGIADQANVDPGPTLDTQRSDVEGELGGSQNVSNVGGDANFFGITAESTSVLGQLFGLFHAVEPLLRAWNVPGVLAAGVGSMALVFGGGMMLIQFLRGFRGED